MFCTISAQWKPHVDESRMMPSVMTIWGDSLPCTENKRSWADVVKGVKYDPFDYNEAKCIDDDTKKKYAGIQQYDGAITESEDESDIDPLIVKLAKRNAKQHNIDVIHGCPNDASGNCAFEATIYNIQDRKEFLLIKNQCFYIGS